MNCSFLSIICLKLQKCLRMIVVTNVRECLMGREGVICWSG